MLAAILGASLPGLRSTLLCRAGAWQGRTAVAELGCTQNQV